MKEGDITLCDCGHEAISNGFSTGYGVDKDGKKICFECCGEQDKQTLRETGKLYGYYSRDKEKGMCFTNWPGTFKLHSYYSRDSWHNFAGKNGRTDFWCQFEGHVYHGVHIGNNNECATLRRTKEKV